MSCCCHAETFAPVYFDLFLPIAAGDTYPESNQIQRDDIDQTLNRVLIEFRVDPADSAAVLTLDSDDGGISITSAIANAWDFIIHDFTAPSAADYSFAVKCIYGEDNKARTIIIGNFTTN